MAEKLLQRSKWYKYICMKLYVEKYIAINTCI